MKIDVKQLLDKQAAWQKSRSSESWGDKIRQSVAARDSLGSFGYRVTRSNNRLWSLREGSEGKR